MERLSRSGHWPWLHNIVAEYDFLCVPMAFATIIGEVGSIAIVVSKWWRPFGIASLYMFHMGVFFLMDPNFICHCVSLNHFCTFVGYTAME